MLAALLWIPALAGLAGFLGRTSTIRRAVLGTAALAHTGLTVTAWFRRPSPMAWGWLQLDDTGLLFLSITSVLFLATSVYAIGYLARESRERQGTDQEGFLFTNNPEAVFVGCLLLFLCMMTLVNISGHVGLTWVAIEATTLTSAPLIYFHRHARSLEATWKYLLICSVGIAIALLGIFFLAVAAEEPTGTSSLLVTDLVRRGHELSPVWLQAAFVFLLVGYGTKMGLAPLHTWLPDAHSEAPSVVSAILSGALLNCAFLGIIRIQQVCVAAGYAAFGQDLLVLLGLISMAVAAVFIVGQQDYKRMLAYSSVEHVGILALGVGLGGVGVFGALLHAVNHSLTKAMLFLLAGNLLSAYGTKSTREVRGALSFLPASGLLWLAGFLAITGTPPFGPFISEFVILKAALDQDRYGVAALYLALLGIVFVGMASIFLRMTQGQSPASLQQRTRRESLLAVLPPAVLGTMVLLLGLYLPDPLRQLLEQAAKAMGGS